MFKIGEFSTLARVSGHLLRHYDEVDLFKPAHVDPQTGYRYYAIEQLSELNRVLASRELGLTLDQIGQLLNENISPEEIQGMLRFK
jgi:DNA-binding transcriptional MerR regulator